jgi:hypothetical protein
MATSSHHDACITDDPETVLAFLTEVVGRPVDLEFTTPGVDMSEPVQTP